MLYISLRVYQVKHQLAYLILYSLCDKKEENIFRMWRQEVEKS